MSTPHAKRRRLNEASKTLHKPFKSPFRTPLKHDTPQNSSDPPSSDPVDVATLNTTVATTPIPKPQFPRPFATRSHISTPARTAPNKTSPSLTREIIQARSDIQILTQAFALATSSKDEDLSKLIDTWRTASRAAAEELFAGTRDRVNRMGGVGAWREREKEQKEWRAKWDREEMEAERERREGEEGGRETPEDTYEEQDVPEGLENKEEQFEGHDDDSFTMDMMLKTLNIDLKLIGYDKDAQRWDG
ncbi:hypothetical protein K491DRAFT_686875 [Lophiostoma macrostomum CBS 122681]|uniref:DNA repair protein Dds20/Mei5 n=1 Tax=Lophiostoma macrostomum CBS 122681 TaxID=1314788 RepID=A0A6A6TQ34_9PLEO|nr:hypothetical protein K491DRAFT_686875 [Lophiostoma macrostomum CBS 122681]